MIEFADVYMWLNEFDRTSLSATAAILKDHIVCAVMSDEFEDAYQVLEQLRFYKGASLEPWERGEILVECGRAYCGMGNPYGTMHMLRNALDDFAPASHKLAVTRLLLGIVQRSVDTERMQAIVNWQKAVDEFQKLQLKADYDNDCDRKEWYDRRLEELKADLRYWASHPRERYPAACRDASWSARSSGHDRRARAPLPLGPAPEADFAAQEAPAAADAASVPETGFAEEPDHQYTYQYLVQILHRDRAQAERLIEEEARLAPKAGRRDHIRTAIIKLLRDRQR